MNQLQAEHLYSLALAISYNGERLADLLGDVDGPGAALAHTAELLGSQLLELAIAHQAAAGQIQENLKKAKEGGADD